MKQRQIPPERRQLYYAGMAIAVLGFLSFISVFFSGIMNFGDFSNFEARGKSMGLRAIIGILMIGGGNVLMGIARSGVAGSGLTIDPEKARQDLEPWSRMHGGMLKDTLDEAELNLSQLSSGRNELPFDERLRRLDKLRSEGLVTQEEYEATKQKILSSA